jgi:Zn-dependent protease
VAKAHGVRVEDITLLPIGGVSRLSHIPEDPNTELKIAISGPLVNLVFAALLLPLLFISAALSHLLHPSRILSSPHAFTATNLVATLIYINLMLAFFNFVPAFPMDGGRLLRAFLAKFVPFVTATRIAARVGRIIAVGTIVTGFLVNYRWMLSNFLLIVVAIFIYLAGWQEERMVEYQHSRRQPDDLESEEAEEPGEKPGDTSADETARIFQDLARKLDNISGRNQLGC